MGLADCAWAVPIASTNAGNEIPNLEWLRSTTRNPVRHLSWSFLLEL